MMLPVLTPDQEHRILAIRNAGETLRGVLLANVHNQGASKELLRLALADVERSVHVASAAIKAETHSEG